MRWDAPIARGTLPDLLAKSASDFGDRPAIEYRDRPVSFVELKNMADTAAAIANLDLVITVDTSIAHLAGAMGKPTWLMNYLPGDWRFNEGQTWYPSIRIFRQPKMDEWGPVIAEVAKNLEMLSRVHSYSPAKLLAGMRAESTPSLDPIITRPCRYGDMTFYRTDKWLGRSLALYSEWSEGEVDLFRAILKPGDVVAEAGANIGAHTIPLAKIVGETGCVYAFEPQPEIYNDFLVVNTTRHYFVSGRSGVKTCQAALGDSKGSVVLEDMRLDNPGGCAVRRESTAFGRTAHQTKLDLLNLERLDFYKLDCEGSELSALKGSRETIERCRPILYCENDRIEKSEELLLWIHNAGYRIYHHAVPLFNPSNHAGYPVNVFGGIVSMMVLCVPKERFDLRHITEKLERVHVDRVPA